LYSEAKGKGVHASRSIKKLYALPFLLVVFP